MAKKQVWTNTGKGKQLTQISDTVWVDQDGNTYVYSSGSPENNSVLYKNADTTIGQSVGVDNNGSVITEISPIGSIDLLDDDEEDDW